MSAHGAHTNGTHNVYKTEKTLRFAKHRQAGVMTMSIVDRQPGLQK